MSEEGGFGISFAEKIFGLLLLMIGATAMYYVYTSTSQLGNASAFFACLNLVVMAVGLVLITAKTE